MAQKAIEVGRAGLVLRGLSPIFDQNEYIGSIEFIANFNSMIKNFQKDNINLIVLMDEKYKRGNALTKDSKIKNYYISQKVSNSDFRDGVKNIDFEKLFIQGYYVDEHYLYSYANIEDISRNIIGKYIIGQKLNLVSDTIDKSSNLAYTIFIANILNLIAVIFVIGYITSKMIGKELTNFKEALEQFIDFSGFKINSFEPAKIKDYDEIGQLLDTLNQAAVKKAQDLKKDMLIIGEVVLTADKVSKGSYVCRINSTSDNPMIVTLKRSINNMLEKNNNNMKLLVQTLKSYENNDYSRYIDIHSEIIGEMKIVMESINSLGKELSKGAKLNLDNGKTLQQSSISMSNSMNNLSQKSQEQAQSLEETTRSLEVITDITRDNTKNSIQMAEIGQNVKQSATTGQKLATQTAQSMDEINNEVTSITESITVIDQIAFQTNILSLNAAVEAATAGEAGKGFAVVAGEVRNLASRSAEAANDIKALVDSANQKASNGKDISDSMIQGYEELNSHITTTIELINKVSNSSKEQMDKIEQINNTIVILDKSTADNAKEALDVTDIAKDVQSLADLLVEEANKKIFR
jgi:methyl-accepting chemotaxis protein